MVSLYRLLEKLLDWWLMDSEETARRELSNVLSRHIMPLFAEVSGKPKLVGTGFLVSSGENHYLISAAHVLREESLFFYSEPKTTRKLGESRRVTKIPNGKGREDDRIDVGVLRLEGPGLPPYPRVEKCPLPITALKSNALPREDKQYLITGFPETKSRLKPGASGVESQVYSYLGVSAPCATYAKIGVDPQDHIVLSFDKKQTVINGKVCESPEPSGMSGSPVWLYYDEDGPNNPMQTPVVGIAIEHLKNHHAILVTDIGVALKLINGIA
jgi:hypothetical protein